MDCAAWLARLGPCSLLLKAPVCSPAHLLRFYSTPLSVHGHFKFGLIREMLPKHISLSQKLALLFHIRIIFNSQFLIFFFLRDFYPSWIIPPSRIFYFPERIALIFFWNFKGYPSKFKNSCVCACAQSCHTLCDAMDCSSPGFSVHGTLQARILERVAIPFSRGSSQPRDRIWVSWVSCLGRRVLYHCTTCEAQEFMYDDDQIIFTNRPPWVFLRIDVFKRTV